MIENKKAGEVQANMSIYSSPSPEAQTYCIHTLLAYALVCVCVYV